MACYFHSWFVNPQWVSTPKGWLFHYALAVISLDRGGLQVMARGWPRTKTPMLYCPMPSSPFSRSLLRAPGSVANCKNYYRKLPIPLSAVQLLHCQLTLAYIMTKWHIWYSAKLARDEHNELPCGILGNTMSSRRASILQYYYYGAVFGNIFSEHLHCVDGWYQYADETKYTKKCGNFHEWGSLPGSLSLGYTDGPRGEVTRFETL